MNAVPKKLKIAVSVGELSADEHFSAVARELLRMHPAAEIRGMGGGRMRTAGVETVVDAERSASVMGFAEIFSSLGKIFGAFSTMKKLLQEWKPDILVVVDYPDFNLRLAKFAHSIGVKVVYFIPPKVWAWRSGRVAQIEKYIDRVLGIFPFEVQFLKSRGYKRAAFVGNPTLDQISMERSTEERATLLKSAGLDPSRPVIAVFPGSRKAEIKKHLKPMCEGIQILRKAHPEIQALINVAPSIDPARFAELVGEGIAVTKSNSLSVLKAAECALLKSGTSNLQAALCGTPFIVFYIASPLSALIVKYFVKVHEFSIVNAIRSGTAPELLQYGATPQRTAEMLEKLMFEPARNEQMKSSFIQIRELLAAPSDRNGAKSRQTSAQRTAEEILDVVGIANA